jgi:DNA-binding response OmpR family regulator
MRVFRHIHLSIQNLFRYILHDVDISCADHGSDALLRLERITPDLIISDIIMPVMDGIALLRMVRERPALARIPFVLMSAIGDDLTMIESFHLGVDDYLVKPVSLPLFRARIPAILNRPPVPLWVLTTLITQSTAPTQTLSGYWRGDPSIRQHSNWYSWFLVVGLFFTPLKSMIAMLAQIKEAMRESVWHITPRG